MNDYEFLEGGLWIRTKGGRKEKTFREERETKEARQSRVRDLRRYTNGDFLTKKEHFQVRFP